MRNLGLMDPAFLGGLGGLSLYDPSAAAYITAVEAADGQALETGVKDAINAFVLGCKADVIWNAIKASCILAGARTLAGALVPLVGAAPTNFNFVAGDYNRKTGLVGNGSTKYLNSNRNNNADPQNSKHMSAFITVNASINSSVLGTTGDTSGHSHLYLFSASTLTITRLNTNAQLNTPAGSWTAPAFYGASRTDASTVNVRAASGQIQAARTSQTPVSENITVFRGTSSTTNARLAFYSIGEALDLALLDARVTALVNALAVAIP